MWRKVALSLLVFSTVLVAPVPAADAIPAGGTAGAPRAAAGTLSGGGSHFCAVRDQLDVVCWGYGGDGQLGRDSTADVGDDEAVLAPVDLGGRAVRQVTAGEMHTCALTAQGEVWCWGANDEGQLGLGHADPVGDSPGDMATRAAAVDLGSGLSAVQVAAGGSTTCAIRDDGSVVCWGANRRGQLGRGDDLSIGDGPDEMGDALTPVPLGTGRSATAIAVGDQHVCTILDDNSLKCWGEGGSGALGTGAADDLGDEPGELGDALASVDLAGRTVRAVAAGNELTCAVFDTGEAACWGDSQDGVLGLGAVDLRGTDPSHMGDGLALLDFGPGRTVQTISIQWSHACAVLDDGSVRCWGQGDWGKLGNGSEEHLGDGDGEMGAALLPVPLGAGVSAVWVAAAGSSTCAVLSDSTVRCWGWGGEGNLANGSSDHVGDQPDEMGDALVSARLGHRAVASLSSRGGSAAFVCIIDSSGAVRCWGDNGRGQLGVGNTDTVGDDADEVGPTMTVVPLGTGRSATQVSVSGSTACAVLDDGSVKCWGGNSAGALGQGHLDDLGDDADELGDALDPVSLGTGRTATQVEVGGVTDNPFVCALLDDGSVKCWGDNAVGQLGLETSAVAAVGGSPSDMGDALSAVDLGTGRTAVRIESGVAHTCALLDNGDFKCWGFGGDGQLGQGATDNLGDGADELGDALATVNVGVGRRVVDFATADAATCAVLDDASVKCWGHGGSGQLGQGNTDNLGVVPGDIAPPEVAVDLGSGRTASTVHAGGDGTVCVIRDDSSLVCWGENSSGQLGRESTDDVGDGVIATGTGVVDLDGTTAVDVFVGASFVCALLDTSQVKCWGDNSSGQLARGDTDNIGDGSDEMGAFLNAVVATSVASAEPPTTTPAGAASSAVNSLDGGTVRFSWAPPTDDGGTAITAYEVQRSTDGVTYTMFAMLLAPTVGLLGAQSGLTVDDTVPDGSTYWYRVAAVNDEGRGQWSDPVSFPIASDDEPPAWTACHATEPAGYWLVEADGTVFRFGDADHHGDGAPPAGHLAIDIEATPTGCGYWVLHSDGSIDAMGDATDLADFDLAALAPGEGLSSFAPTPSGEGLWGFTSRGRVLLTGDAAHRSAGALVDTSTLDLDGPIVDAIPTPSGDGYYMLGSDGGIFAFGDAVFVDSIPGIGITQLDQPAVGLVPDPDGSGYWIVAADGGVFSFDAPFRGSFPGLGIGSLNQPITTMTPYGNGYLQVASDGGVFNFSDKPFSGSLGGSPPDTPIRSLTPAWK